MTAKQRLEQKVYRILSESHFDQEAIDRRVNDELDMNEVLTLGLLPIHSKLRTYVVGCMLRDTTRKKKLEKLKEQVRDEDLVPVEVHGGGKCKITVFMTREAAQRERGP